MNIPYVYEINERYYSALYRCENYVKSVEKVTIILKSWKSSDKNKIHYIVNGNEYIVNRFKINEDN